MLGVCLLLALLAEMPGAGAPAARQANAAGRDGEPGFVTGSPVLATQTVGMNPTAMAVDPHTGHLFLASTGPLTGTSTTGISPTGLGSVTMLDGVSGTALFTATVGLNPGTPVVDSRAGRVFVPLSGGRGGVAVLDAGTGALLRTISRVAMPLAVAVDEPAGHVFVLSRSGTGNTPGALTMLDAASGTVLLTTTVGLAPVAIVVDPSTARVYVANAGYGANGPNGVCDIPACQSSVTVFDAVSGRALATAVFDLCVAQACRSSISVFAAGSKRIPATTVGHAADWRGTPQICGLALDPRTGTLLAASYDNAYHGIVGPLTIMDARSLRPLRLDTEAGCAITIDPETRHAFFPYATSYQAMPNTPSGVGMIDLVTGARVRSIPAGVNPGVVAVDPQTHRGIIINNGPYYLNPSQTQSQVQMVDTVSGAILRLLTFPLPGIAVVVDTAHARAFVLSQRSPYFFQDNRGGPGLLHVLTTRVGRLPGQIAVGQAPSAIGMVPQLHRALVLDGGGQTAPGMHVRFLDTLSGALLGSVSVGAHTSSMVVAPWARRILLLDAGQITANPNSQQPHYGMLPSLTVLDAVTGVRIANLPLRAAGQVVLDPVRHHVVILTDPTPITGVGGIQPVIIDPANGAVMARGSTQPGSVRFTATDSQRGLLYAVRDYTCPSTCANSIVVFNLRTGRYVRTITQHDTAGPLAIDPTTGHIFSVTIDHRYTYPPQTISTLRVLDPVGRILARMVLPYQVTALAYEPVSGRLVAAGFATTADTPTMVAQSTGNVDVFDATTGAPIADVRLRDSIPTDLLAGDGRAFVVDQQGRLITLDAASGAVLRSTPIGRGAPALALDPIAHRLLVATADSDSVSLLDSATGAPIPVSASSE